MTRIPRLFGWGKVWEWPPSAMSCRLRGRAAPATSKRAPRGQLRFQGIRWGGSAWARARISRARFGHTPLRAPQPTPGPSEDYIGGQAGLGWGWLNVDGEQHGYYENYGPPSNTRGEAMGKRRRVRLPTVVPQLSTSSGSSIPEYETDVEDDVDNENINCNCIKHMYRDDTWSQSNFTYDPPRMAFTSRQGTTRHFLRMPSILAL
jgi:hypothetical protein